LYRGTISSGHFQALLVQQLSQLSYSGTVLVTAGLTPCGMVFPIESARERATMPSVLLASSSWASPLAKFALEAHVLGDLEA
jgi:hypothetical protein